MSYSSQAEAKFKIRHRDSGEINPKQIQEPENPNDRTAFAAGRERFGIFFGFELMNLFRIDLPAVAVSNFGF